MNRSELENGNEENREVTELLAALPRVEAPANFIFGVQARIVAGRSKVRSSFFPFLRVAVPLSLVLFFGGLAFFYGTMPNENVGVADVVVPQNYVPDPAPTVIADDVASRNEPQIRGPQIAEPESGNLQTVSVEQKNGTPIRRAGSARKSTASKDERTFTQDSALSLPNMITPPGIPASGGEIPVREILESLGLKVDYVGSAWTVRTVLTNGIAERSGMLANDIVESINDQPIGRAIKLKGSFEGKSVTVNRGGKSIKLDLTH